MIELIELLWMELLSVQLQEFQSRKRYITRFPAICTFNAAKTTNHETSWFLSFYIAMKCGYKIQVNDKSTLKFKSLDNLLSIYFWNWILKHFLEIHFYRLPKLRYPRKLLPATRRRAILKNNFIIRCVERGEYLQRSFHIFFCLPCLEFV